MHGWGLMCGRERLRAGMQSRRASLALDVQGWCENRREMLPALNTHLTNSHIRPGKCVACQEPAFSAVVPAGVSPTGLGHSILVFGSAFEGWISAARGAPPLSHATGRDTIGVLAWLCGARLSTAHGCGVMRMIHPLLRAGSLPLLSLIDASVECLIALHALSCVMHLGLGEHLL